MTPNSELVIREMERHLGLELGTIKPGGDLVADYGADSLDLVEMVMMVEEQLDIEVPDDAVKELELHNVDNLIKYIDSQ